MGSTELAQQAYTQISRANPHLNVQIEQASWRANREADVVVATWQTLKSDKRLFSFDPQEFKAIIVDEAHHVVSTSHLKILRYFDPDLRTKPSVTCRRERSGVVEEQPHAGNPLIKIIGFSATLGHRRDKQGLEAAFDEVVYHK